MSGNTSKSQKAFNRLSPAKKTVARYKNIYLGGLEKYDKSDKEMFEKGYDKINWEKKEEG